MWEKVLAYSAHFKRFSLRYFKIEAILWKLRKLKLFEIRGPKNLRKKPENVMKNFHLEKSLKNHMGSRKNRNFEKTENHFFSIFKVKIFEYFHFSKIFFANFDFENRKFSIFHFFSQTFQKI